MILKLSRLLWLAALLKVGWRRHDDERRLTQGSGDGTIRQRTRQAYDDVGVDAQNVRAPVRQPHFDRVNWGCFDEADAQG